MYLVLNPPRRRKRKSRRVGPIFIEGTAVRLNIVDGRASTRRASYYEPKGRYPKTIACVVCGTPFEGKSGNAAYCSKTCNEERVAERKVAEEMRAARGRRRR